MGASNHSTRILVVDRDSATSLAIRDVLQHHGFDCDVAVTYADALASTRHHLPALMIVDVQLEGGSGFDLARAVRSEHEQHEVPVIFVAPPVQDDLLDDARRAGGVYFLTKPLDPSVLVELVNTALWMPHLIRRHIDRVAHASIPKPPRLLTDKSWIRVKAFN